MEKDRREYYKKYYETNKDSIKERKKDYWKQYREEHKEKQREYNKKYYQENKDKIQRQTKAYRETHKEQRNQHNRERKQKDSLYNLSCSSKKIICGVFGSKKGYRKSAKAEEILGCTIEEFIEYIQSKFKEGMTLENHGEWHIDHIIPVSSAKTEEELIKLNHYTNLQPLWAEENLKKGSKITDTQ